MPDPDRPTTCSLILSPDPSHPSHSLPSASHSLPLCTLSRRLFLHQTHRLPSSLTLTQPPAHSRPPTRRPPPSPFTLRDEQPPLTTTAVSSLTSLSSPVLTLPLRRSISTTARCPRLSSSLGGRCHRLTTVHSFSQTDSPSAAAFTNERRRSSHPPTTSSVPPSLTGSDPAVGFDSTRLPTNSHGPAAPPFGPDGSAASSDYRSMPQPSPLLHPSSDVQPPISNKRLPSKRQPQTQPPISAKTNKIYSFY